MTKLRKEWGMTYPEEEQRIKGNCKLVDGVQYLNKKEMSCYEKNNEFCIAYAMSFFM